MASKKMSLKGSSNSGINGMIISKLMESTSKGIRFVFSKNNSHGFLNKFRLLFPLLYLNKGARRMG